MYGNIVNEREQNGNWIVRRIGEEDTMASNCESCVNYVYDDEMECYCCDMNLDEDDMVKFLTGSFDNCPYYRPDDEYAVVRHQM